MHNSEKTGHNARLTQNSSHFEPPSPQDIWNCYNASNSVLIMPLSAVVLDSQLSWAFMQLQVSYWLWIFAKKRKTETFVLSPKTIKSHFHLQPSCIIYQCSSRKVSVSAIRSLFSRSYVSPEQNDACETGHYILQHLLIQDGKTPNEWTWSDPLWGQKQNHNCKLFFFWPTLWDSNCCFVVCLFNAGWHIPWETKFSSKLVYLLRYFHRTWRHIHINI